MTRLLGKVMDATVRALLLRAVKASDGIVMLNAVQICRRL